MGRYASIEYTGKIKEGKLDELTKALNFDRQTTSESLKSWLECASIDGGYLILDGYYRKCDGDKEFVLFLSKFIEPDDIIFVDEIPWGYRIKEDGSVVELISTWEEGEVIKEPRSKD